MKVEFDGKRWTGGEEHQSTTTNTCTAAACFNKIYISPYCTKFVGLVGAVHETCGRLFSYNVEKYVCRAASTVQSSSSCFLFYFNRSVKEPDLWFRCDEVRAKNLNKFKCWSILGNERRRPACVQIGIICLPEEEHERNHPTNQPWPRRSEAAPPRSPFTA